MRLANAPCSWGVLELGGARSWPRAETYLDQLVEAGYVGTELGEPGFLPRDDAALAEALAARGLGLAGAFVPVRLSEPAALAEGRACALATARRLAAVDPSAVLVLSDDNGADPARLRLAGRVRPEHGLPPAAWRALVAAVMEIAVAVREEAGVGLVVHHHAAGFLETEAEIERLLADTDPERVGLCLDTGHLAFGGGDPVAFARRHAARVRHLHLKDVDEAVAARVRRDGLEALEAVRAGVFTTLGEGGVDVGGVLDALAGAPIGWAVVEHDRLSEDGPSPLESARTSRARLAALGLGASGLAASGLATAEGAR